ncbi:MAG: DUF2225 domain-containing protein [Wujia sp.]
MGLFSDMAEFGLSGYENTNVIDKAGSGLQVKSENDAPPEKSQEEKEKEALYDRHFTCPVCDLPFTCKFVRAGKAKLHDKDTDLRPIYEDMDPIKYDVITCDKCGYSALTRYFGKLSTRQMVEIHNQIGDHFNGIENQLDLYTYDDAIARYKLALLTTVVKKAKNSERAYTSMKLAWVLRGKRMTLEPGDPEIKKVYQEEMECISNAYDGYCLAISSESFPIAGMDEYTLQYVMADMARKLKKYNEAARLLANVITAKNVSSRLKDQALTLKELIKQDIKNSK